MKTYTIGEIRALVEVMAKQQWLQPDEHRALSAFVNGSLHPKDSPTYSIDIEAERILFLHWWRHGGRKICNVPDDASELSQTWGPFETWKARATLGRSTPVGQPLVIDGIEYTVLPREALVEIHQLRDKVAFLTAIIEGRSKPAEPIGDSVRPVTYPGTINGEWQSIESYNDEHPIQIRAPELVSEFNENGETDACALCGDEWYAAKWNNHQDYFESIEVHPTHYRVLK